MPKCTIPMTPCESSQLCEFGYDAATKTLAIRFNGRSGEKTVYTYAEVPPEVFAGLQEAESKGKYFGSAIKGQFEFTKLVDDGAAQEA